MANKGNKFKKSLRGEKMQIGRPDRVYHIQGDRWKIPFKISANLTGDKCRFNAYTPDKIRVIHCDTEDQTLLLTWDPTETLTVDDETFIGFTTLTPIISLEESAELPTTLLHYDVEDYTAGITFIIGEIRIIQDVTK